MKDEINQDTLFSGNAGTQTEQPLAARQRPQNVAELVGQKHFLNQSFKRMLESDQWTGLIFWGPPGTGKTSLAQAIALETSRRFQTLSAVTAGVKEIREVLERSRKEVEAGLKAWILFIDELHRLNKAQQDVLLPYTESGYVRFIGATTENPSFEVNNAICSRCLIFSFKGLAEEDLISMLERAIPESADVKPSVLEKIAKSAIGDGRRALNLLEHLLLSCEPGKSIEDEDFEKLSHSQNLYYDKGGEKHYDTISAFIKSVRGSDPDAALYYLARMLEGGEDPKFIARRLVILASEDIGNANPMGLVLATNAFEAVNMIGMPEARIVLGQATTYLACAEKSNRAYKGIESALEEVRRTGQLDVPMALRNAVTKQMKQWGYGKGYKYAHDHENAWAKMDFLPESLQGKRFYEPSSFGAEKRFQEFLARRGKPAASSENSKDETSKTQH